jgi:WD40 repeat protein
MRPELVVQTGHYGLIKSIAFSNDSRLVASGSLDNTIKIWDAGTGFQIRTLTGHTNTVNSVVFSSDGRLLASGGDDKTARVWNIATGELLYPPLQHSLPVHSVAISPDGHTLATAGLDKLVMLWDLATGKPARPPLSGHDGNISSLAFSPDGKTLASASWDKTVRLWDITTGNLIGAPLQAGNYALMSVAFSSDGRLIASGGSRSEIKIWEVASGRELNSINAGYESISSLAFIPKSSLLISGTILSMRVDNGQPRTVRLWDVETGTEVDSFKSFVNPHSVNSLAVSPDGTTLAINDNNTMSLVDVAKARERVLLKGHSAAVNAIALSSDSKSLVVAGNEPIIRQWNFERQTSEAVRNLEGHAGYVNAVAFSPDNKLLASGGTDQLVRLWDLANGTSKSLKGHEAAINCVAFSRDGRFFASGSADKTIIIWNVQTGKQQLPPLEGHEDSVNMLAFSLDGTMIASASSDRTIRFWSVSDGHQLAKLTAHLNEVECIAFSPDGQMLASGSADTTVKLWKVTKVGNDVETSLIRTLTGHSSVVQSVAFNAGGNELASGSWDRTVRLWDVESGKQEQILSGHAGRVVSLVFARTGNLLATASADSVKLWEMPSGTDLVDLIALDQTDWVAITPKGTFDASQDAQQLMRYVVGVKPLMNLEQLTHQYYEPGLLPKVLGFNKASLLLNPKPFKEATLNAPDVEVEKPGEDSTVMTIRLKNKGGGIGPVRIIVNHVLRLADARGPGFDPDKAEGTLTIDLKQFERFLLPDEDNPIEVRAFNKADNDDQPGVSQPFDFNPGNGKPSEPQQLWAVIVGAGKYNSDQLAPLSAGEDAQAISKAFRIAGERLFPGGVHISTLSTRSDRPEEQPSRDNIVSALRNIAQNPKVTASDILVVYLAGHGVSYGSTSGDYYYLTSEATTFYLESDGDRKKALAGKDIMSLMTQIPTAKRVLILDTCAAGRIREDLQGRGVDESSVNLKAWRDMHTSTGVWLLAGSAANAESFEAKSFGMGLLTYSLLKGLKVDWAEVLVRDDGSNTPELVDVDHLFSYCTKAVKNFARELGHTQEPEPMHGTGSLYIGRITGADRQEIPLPRQRPGYARSDFHLEPEPTRDPIHLSALLDDRLRILSSGINAKLFYIDARSNPGSYRLAGLYTINGTSVQANVLIYDDSDKQFGSSFAVSGESERIVDLVDRIIEEAIKRIPQPQ